MYNRYGHEDRGTYTHASVDDSPLPPPRSGAGQAPPPPPQQSQHSQNSQNSQNSQQPRQQPPPPHKPGRPPEIAFGKGILEALHLEDLDTGDLLLLFLLFFLFRQKADEELLIAIGLLLIL